ncbi:MAG: FtsX-like permease family protein [Candidatus Cloacimonadota bacterium]|nr:FtsX-like permease family protein [Candidatus Cloacimonadota bacterium]
MSKVANFFLIKYLLSGKKEVLRIDNIFLIIGIVISVSVLTISLALFEGYQVKLKETILGVNAHIYIFKDGTTNLNSTDSEIIKKSLKDNSSIVAFTPLIETNLMAVKNNRIKGCILKGFDTQSQSIAFDYHKYVTIGSSVIQDDKSVIIGKYLAKELNVSLNDKIYLVSPLQTSYSLMGLKQRKIEAKIVGIFESGMHTYDTKYIFANLKFADSFSTTPNQFTMFGIKVLPQKIESTQEIAKNIMSEIGNDYQVRTWQEFNSSLFRLISLEKWLLFILLSFLVVVASFNVISTISTMVMNKREEIGILKAFGTTDEELYKIFLGRIFAISSFAIFSGIIMGVIFSYLLSVQNIYQLNGEVYFLEEIFINHKILNLFIIASVSHLIVVATALLPLKKIKKLEIIDIIREKS